MPHPLLPLDELTSHNPVEFGGLYWVNFAYPTPPPGVEERRILDWHPAVVISSPPFCRYSGAVNVLAITSFRGKLRPYHHLLLKSDYPALDTDSLIKTELAYPVLRTALADQHFICKLTDDDLKAVLYKAANVIGITMFYAMEDIPD